jgi:hypothetical protein
VFPPGREVSRGRQRNVSSRLSGLQACGLANRVGVDVITRPVAGPGSGCSVMELLDSGSSRSGSKLEVDVLVEKRDFAKFSGEFARDHFGKRHEPSARVGSHGEAVLEGSGTPGTRKRRYRRG